MHNWGSSLWFTGSQTLPSGFRCWGMAGLGDYACLCVYAIFLVGKVVVSMFTHAASDLIDPQFVVQFVRHLEFLHATFLICRSLWQVAKLHCNLTHPDSWFVEILKYESQKLQVG
jgi:hypothetical protein